jgi:hypothetical protein
MNASDSSRAAGVQEGKIAVYTAKAVATKGKK